MLIEMVEAEPTVMGTIVVGVEAAETQIVEFHMSYRRIPRDQGAFHKHHSRPLGLESDKVR
jgi:hypothetical protein